MRLILFFDLPVEKASQRKAYRKFVKDLKSLGFYALQYSVYVKMTMDQRSAESMLAETKKIVPSEGNVAVLIITEKQFADINFILGDSNTDVINNQDKVVEL